MQTILHLTDIHFGWENDDGLPDEAKLAERKVCLNAMFIELEKLEPQWKPTIICITGDIAWKALKADYTEAKTWLDQLLKICDLTYNKMIICAGNHDIYRPMAERLPRPQSTSEADKALPPPILENYEKLFSEFISFCKQAEMPTLKSGKSQSYLMGMRTIDNIRFITLNSAWFSKDKKDKGNLWIGLRYLKYLESFDDLQYLKENHNCPLTIALIHHPGEMLNDDETHATASRQNTLDYLAHRSHIILTGHTHGEVRGADCINDGALHFGGGSAYAGASHFNSFKLVQIDGDKVTDKSFKFDPQSTANKWTALDVSTRQLSYEYINGENNAPLNTKESIEHQNGAKVQVRLGGYSQRMRAKFSPVDLANLVPNYTDGPEQIVLRDVFVAQHVRENPPPIDIPKDLGDPLEKRGRHETDNNLRPFNNEQQLEKFLSADTNQSPKQVLDVITAPDNRLLVLTGEPGSGKSTLMRYLLTSIIAQPIDKQAKPHLSWAITFEDTFPLLIELRNFYASRQNSECDSFLEYIAYMSKTDQWFLDDNLALKCLESGQSLVMFDGLDEIFDTADRQRVLQEISGFALRYPQTRIIVTSRPLGYKGHILRNAGFAHFGIQDLDDEQITTFIRGWFTLVFSQDKQLAEQRIVRVLNGVSQSKPIRLLAGNPMLLTIMALLSREEELPNERVKFYEKAVEALCHYWDVNRNIELPDERYLNADDKKRLLQRVALRMQAGNSGLKGNIIKEDNLEQEIQSFLIDEQWQPNQSEARKAARRIIHQLRERNYIICLRGPQLYGFVHRTFLEYLIASKYVYLFNEQPESLTLDDLIKLFDKHCRNDEWREVLRLICGQIDEYTVNHIVKHLAMRTDLCKWDGQTPLPELPLAIWCLSEVRGSNNLADSGFKLLTIIVAIFLRGMNSSGFLQITNSFPDFIQKIIDAAKNIGTRWPGKSAFEFSDLPSSSYHPAISKFWVHFLATVFERRDWIEQLAFSKNLLVCQSSMEVMLEKWPDEVTRKFLEKCAVQNKAQYIRSFVLQALAETWPDEAMRKFLEKRSVQDEVHFTCSTALKTLADQWPDKTTRTFLEKHAIQDENYFTRGTALQVLANKWPDKATHELIKERVTRDNNHSTQRFALRLLAKTWPDKNIRKSLEEYAIQNNRHITTIKVLADQWPDDTTRKLIEERATSDDNLFHSAALEILADKWPDDTTRRLIEERAAKDEDYLIRREVLQILVENWPDEATREFLEERAVEDKNEEPRTFALQALTKNWPNEITRKFFEERAVNDESGCPRNEALQTLAENWPDETTRELLEDRAINDEDQYLRFEMLQILALKWPGETTRKLLEDRATQDKGENTRREVLCALAGKWPDEATRKLVEDHVINDDSELTRKDMLHVLAENWPYESTRKLLMERSIKDGDEMVRVFALVALAEKWPDESTRKLFEERAVKDEGREVRYFTLDTLAKDWPDETSHKLLKERARVDGFAAYQLGSRHSAFGKIMFTKDLDGLAPYIDPTKPFPHEHIKRVAEKAYVMPEKVEEKVRSLSAYLGWEIEKNK